MAHLRWSVMASIAGIAPCKSSTYLRDPRATGLAVCWVVAVDMLPTYMYLYMYLHRCALRDVHAYMYRGCMHAQTSPAPSHVEPSNLGFHNYAPWPHRSNAPALHGAAISPAHRHTYVLTSGL
jgi:hypothetical protein